MKNLENKTFDVIASCKTPAQLRVAQRYAYLALSTIGQTLGENKFQAFHLKFRRLLTLKAQTMRLNKKLFL